MPKCYSDFLKSSLSLHAKKEGFLCQHFEMLRGKADRKFHFVNSDRLFLQTKGLPGQMFVLQYDRVSFAVPCLYRDLKYIQRYCSSLMVLQHFEQKTLPNHTEPENCCERDTSARTVACRSECESQSGIAASGMFTEGHAGQAAPIVSKSTLKTDRYI